MNKLLPIIFILLFSITSSLYSAQSVILKSGKTIKGQVVIQNEKGITVKTQDGSTITIEKSKILKVVYKDVSEEEEKRIRAAEEKKLKAQEEAKRKKEEAAERKRQAEEEKRLAAEEKKRLQDEEKNRLEEERLAEENRKKEEEEARLRMDSMDTWDLVWRSAVLPSWGLFYADRNISGSIYTGLFWGSLAYSFQLGATARSAKSNYDNTTLFYQIARPSPSSFVNADGSVNTEAFFIQDQVLSGIVSSSKDQFRSATNQYNGALGFTALIYIIQLTHTYFVGGSLGETSDESAYSPGFHMQSYWESTGIFQELRSETGFSWKF